LLSAWASLLLAGCAAPAPVPVPAPVPAPVPVLASPEPPAEFSLELTVLDRSAAAAEAGTITRAILLADGTLHFGRRHPGPAGGEWWDGWTRWPQWFPPRVRWLGRGEVQALWDLCRAAGLPEGAAGAAPAHPGQPQSGSTVIVAVLGIGERYHQSLEVCQEDAPRCAAVIERLAALAWAEPERPPPPPPRRDFGPDPYAGLRGGP
jgi:hypothetical protein